MAVRAVASNTDYRLPPITPPDASGPSKGVMVRQSRLGREYVITTGIFSQEEAMKLSEYEIGMVSDRALAIETNRFLDGTACTEGYNDKVREKAAEQAHEYERQDRLSRVMDALKYDKHILPSDHIGDIYQMADQMVYIIYDTEGDKLGRLHDEIDRVFRKYAEWLVDAPDDNLNWKAKERFGI
jgi:hypothetical protein